MSRAGDGRFLNAEYEKDYSNIVFDSCPALLLYRETSAGLDMFDIQDIAVAGSFSGVAGRR